jgi:nucleoside-diphosphate-sugar epimerase
MSSEKLNKLGWRPKISLEDGIIETVEKYKTIHE